MTWVKMQDNALLRIVLPLIKHCFIYMGGGEAFSNEIIFYLSRQ